MVRALTRLAALLLTAALAAMAPAAQTAADPDAGYAARDQPGRAREAAAIWDARLKADAGDFDSAWKLARACYWLGGHAPADEQRVQYERGIAAATRAIDLQPARPEGHFWKAANMGALAESFGLRAGLRYRTPIREALETVLRLDPAFQKGSAYRALGRWYAKVPRLFGGSTSTAIEHLTRSLAFDADSTATHFFLAGATRRGARRSACSTRRSTRSGRRRAASSRPRRARCSIACAESRRTTARHRTSNAGRCAIDRATAPSRTPACGLVRRRQWIRTAACASPWPGSGTTSLPRRAPRH